MSPATTKLVLLLDLMIENCRKVIFRSYVLAFYGAGLLISDCIDLWAYYPPFKKIDLIPAGLDIFIIGVFLQVLKINKRRREKYRKLRFHHMHFDCATTPALAHLHGDQIQAITNDL